MSVSTWNYYNPVRVVFRAGARHNLAELTDSPRVVLVTTPGFRRRGVVADLEQQFGPRLAAIVDDVKPNPDVLDVQAQADRLREVRPDTLLALGGGSTIDTAKGIARLLGQEEGPSLVALLRGEAEQSANPALPVIAVPSTAGTGAEVTPFGTVWDHENRKKYSVVGDDLYPRLAVLDPELTVGLPEEVTVSSGLDAVSHALESTWNTNANPVSLGLAAKSLQLSLRSLPVVKADPGDIGARSGMLQASMIAGLAISQSRTALAHSISYPVTSNFDLPHGFACSFTLPALLAFNAVADDGRLAELARAVGYDAPGELAEALGELFDVLDVGKYLGSYLPDRSSVLALSGKMFAPGRADNNLREASEDDARMLVSTALDALGI